MALTVGYTWVDGEVVTATKLNSAALPTIGAGTAATPSLGFSTDTDTGFYSYAANTIGWAAGGAVRGSLGNYFTVLNGDNTTGAGALAQLGFGYSGAFSYQHFIQTRHTAATGGSGNAFAFWVNNSVTAGDSTAPGTNNSKIIDAAASGVSIIGTNTNDSPTAGWVGELLVQTIASGAAVGLTTGTQTNIATITLTPGDWDVSGTISLVFGAGTTTGYARASIGATSATVMADNTAWSAGVSLNGAGGVDSAAAMPVTRFSVATNTPIYLVYQGTFSVSTLSAYGSIRARRMR